MPHVGLCVILAMATGARIGAFLGFTWIASTPRAAQSICAIQAAQGHKGRSSTKWSREMFLTGFSVQPDGSNLQASMPPALPSEHFGAKRSPRFDCRSS
jgi:hypothetical protein